MELELTHKHYYAAGGIGLLLLVFFVRSLGASADEPLPNTPESETQWMCRACRHAFRLTARAAHRAMRAGGKTMPIYCPECGKLNAWRAARCGIHGLLYFVADVPGFPGRCPRCLDAINETVDAGTNGSSAPHRNRDRDAPDAAPRRRTDASTNDAPASAPAVRRVPVI